MFRVLAANCREEKSLDPPDRALALMLRRKVRVGSREVRALCTVQCSSSLRHGICWDLGACKSERQPQSYLLTCMAAKSHTMHELGCLLIVYYGYRITITTRCIVRSLCSRYRITIAFAFAFASIIVHDMISHGMGVKVGSPLSKPYVCPPSALLHPCVGSAAAGSSK